MNAETERVYRALRQSYLTEAPARLAELRKEAEAFRAGKARRRNGFAHGSTSSPVRRRRMGRPISALAREIENWLADTPSQTAESADHLQGSMALAEPRR